jgi:hypothetical protein
VGRIFISVAAILVIWLSIITASLPKGTGKRHWVSQSLLAPVGTYTVSHPTGTAMHAEVPIVQLCPRLLDECVHLLHGELNVIWRTSDAQGLLVSKLMSFHDNKNNSAGLLIQALHVLSALANHPRDNGALNHHFKNNVGWRPPPLRSCSLIVHIPILIHPHISGILNCLVEVNKAILALDSFRL